MSSFQNITYISIGSGIIFDNNNNFKPIDCFIGSINMLYIN